MRRPHFRYYYEGKQKTAAILVHNEIGASMAIFTGGERAFSFPPPRLGVRLLACLSTYIYSSISLSYLQRDGWWSREALGV